MIPTMSQHRGRVVEFGNRKIHAIKLVRELSHVGLKEAKDLVEQGGTFTCTLDAQAQDKLAAAAREGIHFEFEPAAGGRAPSSPSSPSAPAPVTGSSVALRYVSGSQKIRAIKLVRELTGLGLKDAKDVVDRQAVFLRGVERARAQDIAARFDSFGSRIELMADESEPAEQPAATGAEPPIWTPAPTSRGWADDEDDDDF